MDADESNRQFLNGCRKGTVLAADGALCRVASGGIKTDWIQWFALFAGDTSDWLAPSIGEGVMLLCPSGGPAQGIALRGFYSEDFPPPSTDPNRHVRKYRDGALVDSSGVRLLIEMTSDLRATLDAAKTGKVKAIGPVICTHAGGRYTYIGAQSGWRRAVERARRWYEEECAKAKPPLTPDPRFLHGMHFHDLRAKALTNKRRLEGAEAAQALAGHTTAQILAGPPKPRQTRCAY